VFPEAWWVRGVAAVAAGTCLRRLPGLRAKLFQKFIFVESDLGQSDLGRADQPLTVTNQRFAVTSQPVETTKAKATRQPPPRCATHSLPRQATSKKLSHVPNSPEAFPLACHSL
jgi:hypothetical protein